MASVLSEKNFGLGYKPRILYPLQPLKYSGEYLQKHLLLKKSIYDTDITVKVFNQDMTEWLLNNEIIPDQSLYIHRNRDGDLLTLVVHTDDTLYFGSNNEVEKLFESKLSQRFNLELLG